MKHYLFAATLAAMTLTGPAMAADTTLRIGSVQAETDPIIQGFNIFRDIVAEKTAGRIEVKVYPNGQLGDTQELMDQALAGADVAAFTDPNLLAAYTPDLGILGAPYVFDNYEQADKFVSSQTFQDWADRLHEDSGFVTLAFNWYQGPRNLMTNKPITSRADVAGLRIRTPGAPVWVAAGKALGGVPTPMAWSEIYSALQLGAIDAVEAQPAGAVGSRFYEVTKYLTKTEHIQLITGIVVGDTWWNRLSPEDQKIVAEAAVEAGRQMSALAINQMVTDFATMEENGMTISDIDKTEFIAAAEAEISALGLTDALQAVKSTLAN